MSEFTRLYTISEYPCFHLEIVSLWDKCFQFNPDVYILLMGLDKESMTNAFLDEALVNLIELLSEDIALFRYLCPPDDAAIWSRYHRVVA